MSSRWRWCASWALLVVCLGLGLGCNPDAPWGHRVKGRIEVRHGPDGFALPNARVVLRDASVGGFGKKQTTTDENGRFEIAAGPWWGDYEVCAEAPGLALTCSPELFNLAFAAVEPVWREITLVASDALHGQSLLQDGETPCAQPLGVELESQTSGEVVASAGSTPDGRWILGDLPPSGGGGGSDWTLRIRCGSETIERSILLDAAYRDGSDSVDDLFANSPPQILSLFVQSPLGVVQKQVAPGTAWVVAAAVDDPDADPLVFDWSDTAQSLVADPSSSSVPWSAPDASQIVRIFVTVDDGRGGVASETLDVRVGPLEDRFIGHVYDAESGAALSGATVRVDAISLATNAEGFFGTAVPSADFHTLKVGAPGYAPWVARLEGGAAGLDVHLHPLVQYDVDPTQEIEIWDGSAGFMVRIPPNSLEDELGNPPPGNVEVGIHTRHNRVQVPLGTTVVVGPGGEEVAQPVQSASVEITDAGGAVYNLKPNSRATIGFTAPAGRAQPGAMPLLYLDEETGLWSEVGQTVQRHARYEAAVSSFSSWSTGLVSPNANACVHVKVKGGVELPQILRVYVWNPPQDNTTWLLKEVVIQEHDNLITHLPNDQVAMLALHPFNDPANEIGTAQVATGSGVIPLPAYPWNGCQDVTLGVSPPAENYVSPRYLNRIEDDQLSASAYYLAIGAVPAKDDFQKWLDANQFPSNAAAGDVTFFNPNELGLTRRANCNSYQVQGVPQYACYVTKFGKLGESPYESLWDGFSGVNAGDTVAMEYTGTAGNPGDRQVKFYIYEPAQTPSQQGIKLKTAFDSDGETKYVPGVCLHCHGIYSGQFVAFDIHEYEWLGIGQSKISNIQEQVRQWNAYVDIIAAQENPSGIAPADNPARELIAKMYGGVGKVHDPGETAGPATWGNSEFDEVAKPYCRTCHMWTLYPFSPPHGLSVPNAIGPAFSHMCSGEMPHAMGPQLALWSTTNPFWPGELPMNCVIDNADPTITITAPSDGAEVGFGGLNFATYTATAADAEDGASCCLVKWRGDGAPIGYGPTIQHVFQTPGSHTVCAGAVDSNGNRASDCIDVVSTNNAPSVVIHDPVPLETILQGEPHTMFGEAFDQEYAYLELPCSQLSWDFTQVQDPPPVPSFAVGTCNPTFTFPDVGFHTVRLTAIDEFDEIDEASVTFVVDPVPPGSPPGVTVTSPVDSDSYPADLPVDLIAIVTPHGGGPVSLDWTVDWGAGPVTISTVNPDVWIPSDDVPSNCGSRSVTVELEATDSHGSNGDSVDVEIYFPPC